MFDTVELIPALITVAIFLLIGFPVHEFAHAAVAYMQGDATAKLFGRLTLNPIVHFDPIGGLMTIVSLLVGGFLIGWAKPTPVNPANLRDRRNGEVIVALAGPASNLLMAIARRVRVPRAGGRGVDMYAALPGRLHRLPVRRVQRPAGDLQLHPDPAARRLDAPVPVAVAAPGVAGAPVPDPVRDLHRAGLSCSCSVACLGTFIFSVANVLVGA